MENRPGQDQNFLAITIGILVLGVVMSCALDGFYKAFGGLLAAVGGIMTLLAIAWKKKG